jgi:ankyrin repeat protein
MSFYLSPLVYFSIAYAIHPLLANACTSVTVQPREASMPRNPVADAAAILRAEELARKLLAMPEEVSLEIKHQPQERLAAGRSEGRTLQQQVNSIYQQARYKKMWFKAIRAGDIQLARSVLETHHAFNYSTSDDDDDGCKGYTGLLCAIHWSQVSVARLLIEQRANVNARVEKAGDEGGITPLILAIKSPKAEELVPLLLSYLADVNLPQQCECKLNERTPLMAAAQASKLIVMRQLVWAGANINAVQSNANYQYENNNGKTALHWAVVFGEDDMVGYLIDRGASINTVAESRSLMTPIYLAATHEKLENLKMLLKNGAELSMTTWSPAMVAFVENTADEELKEIVAARKKQKLEDLVALQEMRAFLSVKKAYEQLPDALAHLIVEYSTDLASPVLNPNWSERDVLGQLKWLERARDRSTVIRETE